MGMTSVAYAPDPASARAGWGWLVGFGIALVIPAVGFFVGFGLLMAGFSWIVLGFALRSVAKQAALA